MSEDFEGKMQDMEQGNAEEEEEEQQGEEEQEMDKQMGDLQGEGETEKLDEQLWGSDGEEVWVPGYMWVYQWFVLTI